MALTDAQKKKILSPAIRGFIYECVHCGERGITGKYCNICRTKAGRDSIDEANRKIKEERK